MASVAAQVAHVWRRLGFGPRPGDVAAGVAAGGAQAVIEDLLARPADPIAPAWPAGTTWLELAQTGNREVELMITSPAQLQERVAWLLQGLLVISATDMVGAPEQQAHLDTLRAWHRTSYRSLLETVVRSAGMQWYLSGVWSTPPHPNENLARELLELFALGVTHPKSGAANYTEADVKEIARALTGFWFAWDGRPVHFDSTKWDAGTKTFLGASRGAAGVTEVMNAVAGHSSFRYFVPRRLYRDLVGLEPSASTLDSLASVWGSTGDIKGVVAAIARRPEFVSDAAIRSKVKSPVELVVSMMRVLGLEAYQVGDVLFEMRQHPMLPPNVNGWPRGSEWLHAGQVTYWSKVLGWLVFVDNGSDAPAAVVPAVRRLHAEGSNSTGGDLALGLAGLHDVSNQTLQAVRDYAAAGPWDHWRAAATLALVFGSPEFYVN